jgi:hypothetical protein
MLKATIIATIDLCTRYAYGTIAVAILIAIASGYYVSEHFAINTDINTLISPDLSWRQREIDYDKYFPDHDNTILAVVDAPTPELVTLARAALADKLSTDKSLFPQVTQLGGTDFFARNGLLFMSREELETSLHQLSEAAPMVRVPVADPSLRGLSQMIAFVIAGVREHLITLDDATRPFTTAAMTLEEVLAGRSATFSCVGTRPCRHRRHSQRGCRS